MSASKLRLMIAGLLLALGWPSAGAFAQGATPEPAAATAPLAATPVAPAATAATADTAAPPALAAQPAPAAASAAVSAPSAPAQPVAPKPRPWTDSDVARVRAMLRAEREHRVDAQATAQPQPVALRPAVHGDAGAPFALSFNIDAVFHNSPGYDLFGKDDVAPRFGVSLGYDVVELASKLFLAPELGYGYELESQDGIFNSLSTELATHTVYTGATARYVLFPWLQPQVHLAVGASLLNVMIQSANENADHDHSWSPFGSLGGGLLLRTPTRQFESREGKFASLSLGLLVEGGYALRGGASFKLGDHTGPHEIALRQAKLGELSLSGAYVRTSIVARF